MFNFLKKLFGGDATTNKEAGVQIEQVSAPYKVPEPVVAATPTQEPLKPETKPVQKKGAPKKQGGQKPRGPRKPKAKPAAKKPI